MKTILYAGSELLTGDDIADAVLEYCAALADEQSAEIVEIPVLNADGSRATATLLVGPASQIVAKGASTRFAELIDSDTVANLKARTREHRPVASAAPHDRGLHPDDQWDDV